MKMLKAVGLVTRQLALQSKHTATDFYACTKLKDTCDRHFAMALTCCVLVARENLENRLGVFSYCLLKQPMFIVMSC